MLYLIYIVLGLLIVLAVNYAVTAFLAVHDLLENREKDQLIHRNTLIRGIKGIQDFFLLVNKNKLCGSAS